MKRTCSNILRQNLPLAKNSGAQLQENIRHKPDGKSISQQRQ